MPTITRQTPTFSNLILDIMAREVILETQYDFVYKNFVNIKEDITNTPGTKVKFLKVRDIGSGRRLDEEDLVPTQTFSTSLVEIDTYEFANSIEFTKMAEKASVVDLYEMVKELLKRDYVRTVDEYLRSIYSGILNTYFVNNPATYNGATGFGAGVSTMNAGAIRMIVSRMKEAKIPPFIFNGRQYYVAVMHPAQVASLRGDPGWANAFYYGNPDIIYNGMVGIYEGVIIVETPLIDINVVGGDTYYGSLFLGDYQVGLGVASELQIIEDPPMDLGRFRRIGWYQIFGAGIVNQHGFRAWSR